MLARVPAPGHALRRVRRGLLASSVAGAALLGALPAGAGAEDGAVTTTCLAPADAAGIDALLGRAASPLAGQGATFVAEGVAAGIDPRLLLAIAAHETQLETYAPARAIHNPFGLGPGMVFTSDAAAIARAARTLDAYYVQEGRIRIDTIGPKWAPIGAANDPKGLNRHWVGGVSTQYAALGGDPGEPVLIGSQGASCAAQAPTGAPRAASSTPPAATDRSSGPAEVTTLAGAALMICLVGYLAARRRRVVLAAAGAGDSRFAWEGDSRARTAPSHFADEMTAAHAQSAATASEALSIAWASEEAIEDAEWTLDDPPDDEATDEDGATASEIPAEDDVPAQPMDEVLPAPQAAPEPAAAIDPEAAYWSWAEDECSAHDDEQPGWPAGWHPAEEPDAAPAAVIAEPAPVADVVDQAAIVADLVPVLLEGILPIERVCDRAEVTPRMLALMRIVADTPLPVTEQARRLGLPRPLVAGLCTRMEALGLAQREPLADHARRRAVALTPAGYELCADSAPAPDAARVEAVLARMSPAERGALLAGLTALASPSAA